MASRMFVPTQTLSKGAVVLHGSCTLAGAGAPTAVQGKGFSVARTGVGQITVTLEDAYVGVLSVTATVESVAGLHVALVGSVDVVSAKTVVLRTLTEGAGTLAQADIAGPAKLHFVIALKNSTV